MILLSLRARMRDLAWYRKHDGRSTSSPTDNTIAGVEDSLSTLIAKIGEALRKLLTEDTRPRRIGRNEPGRVGSPVLK